MLYRLIIGALLLIISEGETLKNLRVRNRNKEGEDKGLLLVGKCNDGDILIWNDSEKGFNRFSENLRDYSIGCIFSGDSDCVSNKFVSLLDYSKNCANCMGDFSKCIQENCFTLCLGLDDGVCDMCVDKHCVLDFKDCSGL